MKCLGEKKQELIYLSNQIELKLTLSPTTKKVTLIFYSMAKI